MAHIAIAGFSGKVGDCLSRFRPTGVTLTGLVHKTMPVTAESTRIAENFNITDSMQVKETVRDLARDGVRTIINAVGSVDIDAIEKERYADDPTVLSAYKINTFGAECLAKACAEISAEDAEILLLHISTESVFGDNLYGAKYQEEDDPAIPRDPTGMVRYGDIVTMPTMYGLTNALGEQKVLEKYRDGSVVVRMHGVQGPRQCFFARTATELVEGQAFTRVDDMYVAHLVDATIAEAVFAIEEGMHDVKRRTRGIYHLSASDALTPYDITLRFADILKIPKCLVTSLSLEALIESSRSGDKPMARRPHYTILDVSKFGRDFYHLPTVEQEIHKYIALYGSLFQSLPAG